jgi:hypothetical protein
MGGDAAAAQGSRAARLPAACPARHVDASPQRIILPYPTPPRAAAGARAARPWQVVLGEGGALIRVPPRGGPSQASMRDCGGHCLGWGGCRCWCRRRSTTPATQLSFTSWGSARRARMSTRRAWEGEGEAGTPGTPCGGSAAQHPCRGAAWSGFWPRAPQCTLTHCRLPSPAESPPPRSGAGASARQRVGKLEGACTGGRDIEPTEPGSGRPAVAAARERRRTGELGGASAPAREPSRPGLRAAAAVHTPHIPLPRPPAPPFLF